MKGPSLLQVDGDGTQIQNPSANPRRLGGPPRRGPMRVPHVPPLPALPALLARLALLAFGGSIVAHGAANAPASGPDALPRATEFRPSIHPEVKPHGGRISLTSLDLTKPLSEEALKRAGELGSPLSPSRPADPARLTDAAARRKLEVDNALFARAMAAWNRHEYPAAVKLFHEHQTRHPDSPWSGEAELHVGCNAQFSGNWPDARAAFESILKRHPAGSAIYQKAKLRRSVLHLEQGELPEAIRSFREMLSTETDWERRTYAHHWIRQINLYKGKQLALRACGKESVAQVLARRGDDVGAARVRRLPAAGDHGFTVGELAAFAGQNGLPATAVRARPTQAAELPAPFIAHYADRHFVVVEDVDPDGSVCVFDPRLGRETSLESGQFRRQWSGLALVFGAVPSTIPPASTADLVDAVGGCCGIPRFPDDLGPKDPLDCKGLPAWQVNPINLNLVVQDIPLWYDNPVGSPIEIRLTYNSQDSLNQYRPFGNKWVFNYTSYAMESPGGAPAGAVLILMPEGQGHVYQPDGAGGYTAPAGVFNRLTKTGPFAFRLEQPDGSVYRYGVPPGLNGTTTLLLSTADRFGNTITVHYDANGSVTGLTDPLNRTTTFAYNAAGLVSRVTDPFGRSATFAYDATGNLVAQTDMGGTAYGYTYDANVYLTSLIRPAGTTQFRIEPADGINNGLNPYPQPGAAMWENYRVTITDPLGQKEEYHYNGYSRYSWHRDKRQMLSTAAPLEAPKTQFNQELIGGRGEITSIVYSDGQTVAFQDFDSSRRAQAVRDENGHSEYYTYNAQGSVLSHTDARGNVTSYEYAANGMDLLQTIDPLGQVVVRRSYTPSRAIATVTDALDHTTAFAYNAYGQIVAVTNALGEVREIDYNAQRLPVRYRVGATILRTLAYDPIGRISSITDGNGFTMTYTYDNLNRPLRATYPDGTFTERRWTCCSLERFTDQSGRSTSYVFDPLNRLAEKRDPADRVLRYQYDPNGNLVALFDPLGNQTQWIYDPRNRPVAKVFADGTRTAYTYDGVGSLITETNAAGEGVLYTYDEAANLVGVSATGASDVTFTYDARNQTASMEDGFGTTSFRYDAAGQLIEEDGPWTNDTIVYGYDALGRATNRVVAGTALAMTYDSIGRLQRLGLPAGPVSYAYRTPASTQIARIDQPNLQHTDYLYYGTNQNLRLQSTRHVRANASLALAIDQSYDPGGTVGTWSQQRDGGGVSTLTLAYDAAYQLTAATARNGSGTVTRSYAYGYDAAGNRLREQVDGVLRSTQFNPVNQPISSDAAPSAAATYEWNALGQLTAVVQGSRRSEWTYDGHGRRVGLIERDGGTTTRSRLFLWCGAELCEERDGTTGATLKRFLGPAVQSADPASGLPPGTYYLVRDHLGSVRELIDQSGASRARYDYDPFGRRSKLSGDLDIEVGFSGHYYHAGSGLCLTLFRPYHPDTGRWLARDPLGEGGGFNLYGYVGNNVANLIDPYGLWFGIDDLVFTVGGAVVGAGGQLVGDLISSARAGSWQFSGWEDYAGSAIGGAAGGEALLYTGPVGAGLIGGAVGNLSKQGLKNLTGKQCGFDPKSFGFETLVGGATGFVPGIRIPGITAGRGSFNQVYRQIATKAGNGSISTISAKTAGKMFVGRAADTGLLPGTGAAAAAGFAGGASGLVPASESSCPCK